VIDLFILLSGLFIGATIVWFSKDVMALCRDCGGAGFYRVSTEDDRAEYRDDSDSLLCGCQIGLDLKNEGFGPTTIYAWWKRH